MDDLWVRIGLVAGMLLVAIAAALWLRKGMRNPIRDVTTNELAPGVYLFTSESCPTCSQARDELDRASGSASYTEVRWEDRPGVFVDVGVDAVPAVLVVSAPGRGRLYPGQPRRVLAEL